jgi:hypothetical protein
VQGKHKGMHTASAIPQRCVPKTITVSGDDGVSACKQASNYLAHAMRAGGAAWPKAWVQPILTSRAPPLATSCRGLGKGMHSGGVNSCLREGGSAGQTQARSGSS